MKNKHLEKGSSGKEKSEKDNYEQENILKGNSEQEHLKQKTIGKVIV